MATIIQHRNSINIRHVIRYRNIVQTIILLLTLAIGFQFYLYVNQAERHAAFSIPRPPGVEGFLPIGALMGWKRFALTGKWDPVHPAAMVVLGFAAFLSLFFRKAFCGWFCPVGTLSEGLWRLGRFVTGKNRQLPRNADSWLRLVKYGLLVFFGWVIVHMDADQISEFIRSPYYRIVDVKMLFFFTHTTRLTLAVLFLLVLLSVLFKNFWCRYFCPYGAFMGLFSFFSPTRIQRDKTRCTHCRGCERSCPAHLPIAEKIHIHSPECTGCMDCISVCPVDGALGMTTMGMLNFRWTAMKLGLTILILYGGIVFLARITDHWQGNLSDREFAALLQIVHLPEIRHPNFRSP